MEVQNKAIIIDNGSGIMKAGFAGDDLPKVKFPTIIGRLRHEEIMIGVETQDLYIGNEAIKRKGFCTINYPIENGIVKNWDEMEKILNHILDSELKIKSEDHPFLLTEPPFNPKINREKTTQIMFETFDIPAFYVASQGFLSVYSSGKNIAMNIEIGDGICYTFPYYNGYTLRNGITRTNIGGRNLTDYLVRILTERDYFFESTGDKEIVKDIKEKLCYVSIDFDKEMEKSQDSSIEKNYDLPDGNILSIGNERFRIPEVLFKPNLIGKEKKGIHQMIYDSIFKCDLDLRNQLFENILLTGGSSLFPGIVERIKSEIAKLAPDSLNINIDAPSNREYSVWIGGSILASLSTFQNKWISKEEYEEFGPSITYQKCFY
ncbi:actin-7-related [Anaeramoeba ignava]|uniref:Actin-7-related n=1 Tax=Anaeramoeba ignava TaxID=1746090 RepID=A0A9Q0LVU7_ANAIG|nr:actin-7-related [Anaeramoeba ignava]